MTFHVTLTFCCSQCNTIDGFGGGRQITAFTASQEPISECNCLITTAAAWLWPRWSWMEGLSVAESLLAPIRGCVTTVTSLPPIIAIVRRAAYASSSHAGQPASQTFHPPPSCHHPPLLDPEFINSHRCLPSLASRSIYFRVDRSPSLDLFMSIVF
ncbi:hypothetical protein VTN96DRAFT_4545 [Rasamsonia emersonii]